MLMLIVRQSLPNGAAKTWKLRSTSKTQTFGSSRLADIISIDPASRGIQGVFEFREGHWWYIDMDLLKGASAQGLPALCLNQEHSVALEQGFLKLTPITREVDLYLSLQNAGQQQKDADKKFQLYMVRQSGQVIETRVLNLKKKFKPQACLDASFVTPVISADWNMQKIGDLEILQRTVSLEDVSKLAHISGDQLVDKESKKSAFILLAAAVLLVTLGLFAPKNQTLETVATPPRVAQKIIVKTELKPKRKKTEAAKPQQVVIQNTPAPVANTPPAGGGRVANMMKGLQGGRVSQLIGKVSAQAAKSSNVVIASGVKAGSGASGRALAAVGNMERSGRNWGTEGTAQGVVISTAGRGGGKNAAAMGGLAAGSTGNAGVGLIEEESEITGGLDREVIAQYIKSQLGQILYCYERQLSASPELFGKVAVKFTIGPSGKVEQQLIGDTTLKNATVEGCILNRVAAWKFPNPQGGTRVLVTYPFLFKSTN